MRTYYHTCPHCGANLDPGEWCDCKEKEPGAAATTSGAQIKLTYFKYGTSIKHKQDRKVG